MRREVKKEWKRSRNKGKLELHGIVQEELIKNDANSRIFSIVDETQAYQQMEKEYLAS